MKLQQRKWNQQCIFQFKLCFVFLLLFTALPIQSIETPAAQNIKQLPFVLANDWLVCSHFSERNADCSLKKLPIKQEYSKQQFDFQTYSKQVIIDSNFQLNSLALWLEYVDDADKVFFNNYLIGKTGEFPPSYKSGFRQQRLYLIPSKIINFDAINTIEIHTFSSRNLNGVLESSPVIDDYVKLYKNIRHEDYLMLISSVILLLLTFFQLFYFVVVKNSNEILYLALIVFSFACIALLRSNLPLNFAMDLSIALKLESFMLCLAIIGTGLFLFAFFELQVRRIYKTGLTLIAITSTFVIIWPYTENLRLLFEINYMLIVLICFLVPGSALVIAVHKRRKYGYTMTLFGNVGLLAMIYDVLMHSTALFKLNIPMDKTIMPIICSISALVYCMTILLKYWQFFKGTTFDHLTGALLRPAFFQRLTEEMQRSQRGDDKLLVAIIDIEQAREISKNYGYSISNHLLTVISQCLIKSLRSFDLICRFSDDQFCIAAAIDKQENADAFIQRLYQAVTEIRQPISEDTDIFIDITIGAVIYNSDTHLSVSQLLQDVGYALSKAQNEDSINYYLTDKLTMHI